MEKIWLQYFWMWLAALLNIIAYVLFGLYIKRWQEKWENTSTMRYGAQWEERVTANQMFL